MLSNFCISAFDSKLSSSVSTKFSKTIFRSDEIEDSRESILKEKVKGARYDIRV